jgi:hypothetical protein
VCFWLLTIRGPLVFFALYIEVLYFEVVHSHATMLSLTAKTAPAPLLMRTCARRYAGSRSCSSSDDNLSLTCSVRAVLR